MAWIFVAAAIGVLVGAVAVWAAMSGKVASLKTELAERRVELEAQRRLDEEKDRTVQAQLKGMMAEMGNATVKVLEAREKALAEKNAEQVRGLLEPMRQQLADFRKAAEESKRTNGDLGAKIGEFFLQAKSFTDALTGANKKQGNWGECILGRVLETCGLKEGEHYLAQTGSGAGIPDYQVFDPGSAKILVVDSKMSWTKYEQAYRLPEGEERRAALREHVASVKRHVDELHKADYPRRLTPPRPGYRYVPLTAMFVPCDAALAAALETDPALVDYGFKRNVALVSPLTLFGFLQLVSRAWSKYSVDRNTDKIYAEAKKLVSFVDRLFKVLEELGDGLAKVVEKHGAAMKLAAKDPSGQCVKGPAIRILELGGSPDRGLKSRTLADGVKNSAVASGSPDPACE